MPDQRQYPLFLPETERPPSPITLPQIFHPDLPQHLFSMEGIPTAEQEALQKPDIDPVRIASFAATGGLDPSGLFGRLAYNTALETALALHGKRRDDLQYSEPSIMRDYPANIKSPGDWGEILGKKPTKIPVKLEEKTKTLSPPTQGVPPQGSLIDLMASRKNRAYLEEEKGQGGYEKPRYMWKSVQKPDYYTPEVRAQAEGAKRPFSLKETQRFRRGYPVETQEELFPQDVLKPRPKTWPGSLSGGMDVAAKFGKSAPPDPQGMVWSGLSLGDSPFTSMHNLQEIQKAGGMSRGWFANTPAGNFGPLFIGAHPKDLPPIDVVPRDLRVDPPVQVRPRFIPGAPPYKSSWDDPKRVLSTYGQKTASGRDLPRTTIHPSKLHVIDNEGHYYGTVAEHRPGLDIKEPGAVRPKGYPDIYRESISGFEKMLKNPQEVASQNWQIRQMLKENPDMDAEGRAYWAKFLRSNEEYLEKLKTRGEVPLKNWFTTELPDIRSLFEEAEP